MYIGYDSREADAYFVAKNSINRLSPDIVVEPLMQNVLRANGMYRREVDEKASTDFSLTRFLTPILARGIDKWAIFVDCDFLFTADIEEKLEFYLKGDKACYVVKHEYTPKNTVKMDGKVQHVYPRKNWSSFIVWNTEHPTVKDFTVDMANELSPADLHRFTWIKDEDIGELPINFNFLVGEYDVQERLTLPYCIHYTHGGPWFKEYAKCDYAYEWLYEYYLGKSNEKCCRRVH